MEHNEQILLFSKQIDWIERWATDKQWREYFSLMWLEGSFGGAKVGDGRVWWMFEYVWMLVCE